ncbi:MAG: chitobiase/beta-hexosaminidase C-terminal domain-containing protein, partial [Bacteroidales bacterium]|nr:chitobiase/beta-hexosaminidase C-terminal domain-containing protein [Bacteroidales bacterium]
TDWTGEYLITYTNGNVVKALAGSSGTSTNYGTQEDVSEYLVGNKITANATTDAKKVTARSTSNGYTLYLENVGYLGWNSGNSLVFDEDVTDGRNEWTISISDGAISVDNVGESSRTLRYNTSSPRFACYTGGQAAITLYKSPREVPELIANPTFNPAEGTFFNSVDVTLACETDGATIYYTLDGTDPTDASTAYTEAIHITETATVKAIAIKNGASSEIVSATYTISNIETVATPVIAPEAGNYNDPQQITITCTTDEAIIYYTTDGTDPTAESTLYTEPFTLSASATVKAVAVKEGYNNSDIASAVYTMPVFLENLAAVYSTADNDQYKITGDVVFVFRDHRYMFVKDATAGMLIYDNNDSIITTEYNEGDVISGGIMGKTSIFRGLYEVVPTANLAVSTENNGPVEPIVVTIPQMSNENDFMSQLVTVQNLTVTGIDGQNIIVSDGENTMKIFDRFNLITESNYAVDDVITSVTGFVSKYNSDYQIFPRTAADIVKREVPADPTFTPEAGIYTTSVTVTLACETEGATIYYTLNDTDTAIS